MTEIGDTAVKTSVHLLCKNIQCDDRIVRQKALKDLLRIVAGPLDADEARELFDHTYLHIIKCYADKFETSRALATSIFGRFIECLPSDNDYYLGYLVPVLKRRIGMSEIVEDSEEMRLQLIEQVYQIVDKFKYKKDGKCLLLTSYNDIMDILAKTLTDPYSAVQQQACQVIKIMPKATPFQGDKLPPLVVPLIALLKHRHSAVRILGIETLGVVGLHVDTKDDMLFKVISAVNVLAMDLVSNVRLACGRVGCEWMLNLRDRYSFFGHILPMVLLGLIDDNEAIRAEINEKFLLAGRQYAEENESDFRRLALSDDPVENYDWIDLPRPPLACRELVARRFQQVRVIGIEMQDWKEEVRLHSLKLLSLIVIYSESNFFKHLEEIFPSLIKCCQDTDRKVVAEAKYVSKLIGTFVMFDFWFDRKLKMLKDMRAATAVGQLRCFAAMFSGAQNANKMHAVERVACVLSSWVEVHSLDADFLLASLEFVEQLIEWYHHKIDIAYPIEILGESLKKEKTAGEKVEGEQEPQQPKFHQALEERFLLQALIKNIAFAEGIDDQDLRDKAVLVLKTLASTDENLHNLYEVHVGDFITLIDDLELSHSERSDRILLLSGCLTLCGIRRGYFDELKNALVAVLTNSEPNARIKILSSIAMAMMNWSNTMSTQSIEQNTDLMSIFMDAVIEPCLTWKAGRSAESIRTMAAQALCAMAQGAPCQCASVLPKHSVLLNTLVDDSNAITRAYTLKTLMICGPVTTKDYSDLTMSVLARLDDPSSDCRALAVQCISTLMYHGDTDEEPEVLIKHVLATLTLHLDDPEIKLHPYLIESITKIVQRHPKVGKEAMKKLADDQEQYGSVGELKAQLIKLNIFD